MYIIFILSIIFFFIIAVILGIFLIYKLTFEDDKNYQIVNLTSQLNNLGSQNNSLINEYNNLLGNASNSEIAFKMQRSNYLDLANQYNYQNTELQNVFAQTNLGTPTITTTVSEINTPSKKLLIPTSSTTYPNFPPSLSAGSLVPSPPPPPPNSERLASLYSQASVRSGSGSGYYLAPSNTGSSILSMSSQNETPILSYLKTPLLLDSDYYYYLSSTGIVFGINFYNGINIAPGSQFRVLIEVTNPTLYNFTNNYTITALINIDNANILIEYIDPKDPNNNQYPFTYNKLQKILYFNTLYNNDDLTLDLSTLFGTQTVFFQPSDSNWKLKSLAQNAQKGSAFYNNFNIVQNYTGDLTSFIGNSFTVPIIKGTNKILVFNPTLILKNISNTTVLNTQPLTRPDKSTNTIYNPYGVSNNTPNGLQLPLDQEHNYVRINSRDVMKIITNDDKNIYGYFIDQYGNPIASPYLNDNITLYMLEFGIVQLLTQNIAAIPYQPPPQVVTNQPIQSVASQNAIASSSFRPLYGSSSGSASRR